MREITYQEFVQLTDRRQNSAWKTITFGRLMEDELCRLFYYDKSSLFAQAGLPEGVVLSSRLVQCCSDPNNQMFVFELCKGYKRENEWLAPHSRHRVEMISDVDYKLFWLAFVGEIVSASPDTPTQVHHYVAQYDANDLTKAAHYISLYLTHQVYSPDAWKPVF